MKSDTTEPREQADHEQAIDLLRKLEADKGFNIVCMDGTPNVVDIIKAAWQERAAPIAAQLDQDAERAAFEKHFGRPLMNPSKPNFYNGRDARSAWEAWKASAARRTEPVAAQLDADNLPPPVWGAVETVGDMVHNLLMLDQSLPIHAAFHVDIAGERRCRTRPISISRERVIDGKWVDVTRKDVPYAIIVWAKQNERIDGRTAGTASEAAPEAKSPMPILYRFDRYKGACKMAEGIGVHATSMAEAIEKAHEVARTTGMPTDGVEIRFSNNDPCAPACRCSICDRAAAPSTQEGAK